jgi:hypothetical protein
VLFVSEKAVTHTSNNAYSLKAVNWSFLLVKNTVSRTSKILITGKLLIEAYNLSYHPQEGYVHA